VAPFNIRTTLIEPGMVRTSFFDAATRELRSQNCRSGSKRCPAYHHDLLCFPCDAHLFGPTQLSSENDEAAESLRAPLLVVVHAPFPAAITQIGAALDLTDARRRTHADAG
jgi:hypothetical protein